nr:hypothetical protein CFP56_39939 [Quercus suber]
MDASTASASKLAAKFFIKTWGGLYSKLSHLVLNMSNHERLKEEDHLKCSTKIKKGTTKITTTRLVSYKNSFVHPKGSWQN